MKKHILCLGDSNTHGYCADPADCISIGMERLVRKAQSVDCWGEHAPNILIVCPPPIHPEMSDPAMGTGCDVKTRELSACYEATAKLVGAHFLDAAECEFNQIDHMHLTGGAMPSWRKSWRRWRPER